MQLRSFGKASRHSPARHDRHATQLEGRNQAAGYVTEQYQAIPAAPSPRCSHGDSVGFGNGKEMKNGPHCGLVLPIDEEISSRRRVRAYEYLSSVLRYSLSDYCAGVRSVTDRASLACLAVRGRGARGRGGAPTSPFSQPFSLAMGSKLQARSRP